MSTIELKVPDIGDFKNVSVIELLVKPGDTVKKEQSLITVESDKASMEIPSDAAGVVKEMKVKLGDKVSEGSAILLLETQETTAAVSAPAPAASPPPPASVATPVAAVAPSTPTTPTTPSAPTLASGPIVATPIPPPGASEPTSDLGALASQPVEAPPASTTHAAPPHASPSVRKFARELGVDLTKVQGSGPKNRIVHEDVKAFVKGVMSGATPTQRGVAGLNLLPWPPLDFAKFGKTELMPLSRIKKMSGPNLHRNWIMIPHVTQYEQADVTELESFRVHFNETHKKDGVRLTMLAFVIKAVVTVLKRYPEFNSSLDEKGENLILKHYWHIGFAADTVHGLVVPVVKDADKKGVVEIAKNMADLAALAREGKLSPSDMQGASFTITSLGGIGGTYFTPIINAPEVSILGLSRLSTQPVWNGKEFAPRLILPLSLAYDHRVIDGAQGTRFTTYLAEVLADIRNTIL